MQLLKLFCLVSNKGAILKGKNVFPMGAKVVKVTKVVIFERYCLFVFEVLQPSQPNGVILSTVSLPNHTFNGQA